MAEISLDPILTENGLAAMRNADATGIAAKITHIALGDTGSTPVSSVQTLQNEILRVSCFSGGVTGNKQITVTANIPAGTPEFYVREIGFFLEDGTLFAYWSHPEQPLGYRSQTTPWFFKFVFSWNVAGTVDVIFDTTSVLSRVAQDVSVLEEKVRHTVSSAGLTPSDADNTQLTQAIDGKINLAKEGKADIDLSNSPYTTNRILEIPQNIKLELNDGLLTLKAGSKVYDGNGNHITIQSDLTKSALSGGDTQQYLLLKVDGTALFSAGINDANFAYEPSTGYVHSDSYGDFYLPLAITSHSGTSYTSVDQVFNQIGYIWATVFVIRDGYKTLSPDGRNADGTCKNKILTYEGVITQTYQYTGECSFDVFIQNGQTYCLRSPRGSYLRYDAEKNLMVDTSGELDRVIIAQARFSGGKFISVTPYLVDSVANFNASNFSPVGKSEIVHFGVPAWGSGIDVSATAYATSGKGYRPAKDGVLQIILRSLSGYTAYLYIYNEAGAQIAVMRLSVNGNAGAAQGDTIIFPVSKDCSYRISGAYANDGIYFTRYREA